MPNLVVDNISKEFATRGEPLRILHGVSLQLSAGQNLAILGPSGSGKSTLLHALGTLDPPTSGQITLDGQNIYAMAEKELAHFRNHNIGFIFQDHYLLPQLSVLENVLIPALAEGSPNANVRQRAQDLIDRVGLGERRDHRPAELSGGERGRVAVARALVNQPRLVLADEPTGNLDQKNAQHVGKLLLELQRQENAMLVAVTHSQELASRFDQRKHLDLGTLTGEKVDELK
jgi:lipoprotein-releasing system ATP-binding protein